MSHLQLPLPVYTPEQIKNAWAFAARKGRGSRRAHAKEVITAASRQAQALGIRAGMAVSDAYLLLPELRVLVYHQR